MITQGSLPVIGRAWTPRGRGGPPLAASTRLGFSPWVLPLAPEPVELTFGTSSSQPWEVLRFEGGGAEAARRIVRAIERGSTIADVAKRAGVSLEETADFLGALYQRGAVVSLPGSEIPGRAFYEHLRSVSRCTFQSFGPSPLLLRFDQGPVSPRLALGFLLENYHFAAAASSHQGAAIASMPSDRMKTAFSEHLSIEYWHFAWLKRGLVAAGLTEDEIERSSPLLSTLGQINHLRWLAMSDPLAYSACIGIGEGDPTAKAAVDRFWARYAEYRLLPEEAFAPFREHDVLDCDDDHESFGGELFSESGAIPWDAQVRIRRRVVSYCALTRRYHEEAVSYYGPEEGPRVFSLDA